MLCEIRIGSFEVIGLKYAFIPAIIQISHDSVIFSNINRLEIRMAFIYFERSDIDYTYMLNVDVCISV